MRALAVQRSAARGREAQTLVHRAIGAAEPRGWRHQIRNEAVATVDLQRGHRLFHSRGRVDAAHRRCRLEPAELGIRRHRVRLRGR